MLRSKTLSRSLRTYAVPSIKQIRSNICRAGRCADHHFTSLLHVAPTYHNATLTAPARIQTSTCTPKMTMTSKYEPPRSSPRLRSSRQPLAVAVLLMVVIVNALVWCAAAAAVEHIAHDPPRQSGGSARKMQETEDSAGPVRDDVVRAMNQGVGVDPPRIDPERGSGGISTPFAGKHGQQPRYSGSSRVGGRAAAP